MTHRRDFLKSSSAALCMQPSAVVPPSGLLRQAREMIGCGALGRIEFCRVQNTGLRSGLRYVLDRVAPSCICEVDAAAEGTSILGSRGTLLVTENACQIFLRDA